MDWQICILVNEKKDYYMIDYIWEYLENRGQYIYNDEERNAFIVGIEQFLIDNEIDVDSAGYLQRKIVSRKLSSIRNQDLKAFFLHYPMIRKIYQIVSEYVLFGETSQEEKCEIYLLMLMLFIVGLEDRYVPKKEVKEIMKFI